MIRCTRVMMIGLAAAVVAGGMATAAAAQPDEVTFSRDVAPILRQRCEACHREGQMAPMSLVTYEEVRPWARAIRSKVVAREMPPWHIDKTVGIQEFGNDISLTDAQIATVAAWVDAGAPRGNPADLPPPVAWPSGDNWRLAGQMGGDPDLIVVSPAWTQPSEGQDQWYQPLVETGLTEDRWVRGVEVRPTIAGRQIVHHALARVVQREEPGDFTPAIDFSGRGAFLTEFAVGKNGDVFRENTGKLLKAGAGISYDIHYHSVGEDITDQVEVGLWFYPKGVMPKYRVYAQVMGTQQSMQTFDLPPGEKTVHHAYIPLSLPARLENYQPHMHVRGKAMSMEAIYPDGRVEMLSHVANFDFNWHVNYVYAEDSAPVLPQGTVIHLTAWHDNTASNPANPDPEQWVGWGQRSYDDMYHAHVNVTYLTEEDYEQIVEERAARRTDDNQ